MRAIASSWFIGVVLSAGIALSGCAVINPHVAWKPSEKAKGMALENAIAYADEAKAAYKRALGQQSQLASWLGIGLIPLGAAALGLGITGGNPAAVTALGLMGASGYGVGTWLYSKPQQRAWVAGYNATTCAVDAVLPLLYVERNRTAIDADVGGLDTAIANLNASLGEVRARLLDIGDKPPGAISDLVNLALQRVREGDALRATAHETRGKAEKMRQEAATAGASLKEAVDRISGQVSAQMVEAGPDIQILAGIVNGLAQSYGQFVRVPEGLRPRAEPKAQAEGVDPKIASLDQALRTSLASLQTRMLEAESVTRRLADTINAVTSSKPIDKLRACGVSGEQIVTPITVEPGGAIELDAGKTGVAGRVIRGGSAPYVVGLQGDTVEGLTVRQTEPFGPAFVVQITPKTPAGDYVVLIADRAGQRVFVPVHIKGAAPATAMEGTTPVEKASTELKQNPRSFELSNPDVTVSVVDAAAEDNKLAVDVTVKAKSGPTTSDTVNAVKDDQIVAKILTLTAVKNYGIDKQEMIRVRSKKAAR